MSDKKLFLLDGHALVYRAHYAFIARPLINSKGWNTSAVAGFTRTLIDLINNQNPTHIAVSFDLSGPTFRHEMYEPYKANREAQPEDITFALPYIRKMVEAFKIPVVTKEGYEADDVIGTLAKQAEKEGFEVYMVTPDKDYAQLVSDKVFLYKPGRQGNEVEIMGQKEVCEKWGIKRVDQVIDVLGLQGDSVDNIPGIPGIGPKTAVKLLEEFDSVEGVIENSDKLKGKQKERVEEFAEQAILSKQLATIDINAPVKFDAKQYELEEFDRETLEELFKELEFRTLANSILGGNSRSDNAAPASKNNNGTQGQLFTQEASALPDEKTPAAHSVADHNIHDTPHTYQLVQTDEGMADLVKLLSSQKEICFDTETTDIDANVAELVGISFAIKAHEAYYIPVPEDKNEAKRIIEIFRPIFENEAIAKIGQNLKYDALVLKWHGVELKGLYKDTMLYHYLLEPELRHGMDYLAETYLKYQPVSIETLIGKKGKNQLSMRDVEVEKVSEYAAEDADITLQLKNYFEPLLEKEGLSELYETMEGPLVKVLVDLEHSGVNLDVPFLEEYSKELGEKIDALEKDIHEEAGVKFNIASPKQIGEILFDHMKIPYRWRKTKTGQYSTDEEKLSELAQEYPFAEKILEYRSLTKLKSTYVDALPKMVNPVSKRIHSSFNQALAATGRLSSNNPNLQNIPIRTEEGRKIRKAFIPKDENHILLAADYSQIELRLIAEISGDEAMLEAFASGQDIHRATAARVYGVPFEEVTSDQRRNAKTVNFSIIYGAGATNLSRQLNIKRGEASDLIKQYFAQYQGLKDYMDKTVEDARKTGYVKTLMGRRRYLRDINSRNNLDRSNAERVAINTPIQGSAADMIKLAMINIHKALAEGGYKTEMILQVHDELVFDVYKPELEKVKPLILDLMKNAIPSLKVPILVEAGTGEHWLEAH
ncbi:MAG: DNA polymerase I [Saprospiraceae bacterium]